MDFGLLVRDRVQSSFLILNDFERINQFLFPLEIIRKAMFFWCLLGEWKLINLLKILLILELKSGDHPGSQFFYKCAYYCLVTPGVLHLNPVSIYLLKVNNKNTRARCEICSKLTIKTPERRQWHSSLKNWTFIHTQNLQLVSNFQNKEHKYFNAFSLESW